MFLETQRKDSRRSRNYGIIGSSLHPTSSAGSGKPDGDVTEEVFYSCKQCGMWCKAGEVQSPGSANDGDGGNVFSGGDFTVQRGFCPFCGSANSRGN